MGAPEQPQRKRQITTPFPGKCSRCKAPYGPGDGVWIIEGKPGVTCAYCAGVLR